jgi:beta-glucanase (GH16 family)
MTVAVRVVAAALVVSAAAGMVSGADPARAASAGRRERLVFADEFNGPAGTLPDPTRWVAETGPRGRSQLQYYTAGRNAYLDGRGRLVIVARRARTPGAFCPTPGGDPPVPPTPCRYTSAKLTTNGRAQFQYGRFVARIKVARGYGLWSAFWLVPSSLPTPRCHEIDIMEQIGRQPRRTYATVHGPAYCGKDGISNFRRLHRWLGAKFRTYALTWTPNRMVFAVDGVRFFTLRRPVVEAYCGPWLFDAPYYLVLNLMVGGIWPGPLNPAVPLPRRMLVDYVRVYQRPGPPLTTAAVGGCLPSMAAWRRAAHAASDAATMGSSVAAPGR